MTGSELGNVPALRKGKAKKNKPGRLRLSHLEERSFWREIGSRRERHTFPRLLYEHNPAEKVSVTDCWV